MKRVILISFVATILAFSLVGCQTPPQARVVRLKLDSDSIHWQYSVNGNTKAIVPNASLPNQLSRLRLHHGDLILFGTVPFQSPGPASTVWDWLSNYCVSNRVAAYQYLGSPKRDIFSVPVYHWVAPFNNPRTLTHASFFYEGEFLGYRMDGYQIMLRRIEQKRPHKYLFLAACGIRTQVLALVKYPTKMRRSCLIML
jgi:hypothetical protein